MRRRISADEKVDIYDRTRGKCHICHKKLSLKNHGRCGARGSWHVDHSRALDRGGTCHTNNLFAACIPCNLDKSTTTSRTARARFGTERAPLSRARYEQARTEAIASSALAFGTFGALIGGRKRAVVGTVLGLLFGREVDLEG
jgi:5-methylcytosine-specific restriction endonuclease McrA